LRRNEQRQNRRRRGKENEMNSLVEQIRLKDAALKQIYQAYGALTAGLIAKEALGMVLSSSERLLLDEWRAQDAARMGG
jgi:hypothetical protein